MAYWDSKNQKTIHYPPIPYPNYPGWLQIDCGCCHGIEWGGDYPRECDTCNQSGFIAEHISTGLLAKWPGGPFCG